MKLTIKTLQQVRYMELQTRRSRVDGHGSSLEACLHHSSRSFAQRRKCSKSKSTGKKRSAVDTRASRVTDLAFFAVVASAFGPRQWTRLTLVHAFRHRFRRSRPKSKNPRALPSRIRS
jgi:hypothetical protein